MNTPKLLCKRGHKLEEPNVIYKIGEWPRNGRVECKICKYKRSAEWRRKNKWKKNETLKVVSLQLNK